MNIEKYLKRLEDVVFVYNKQRIFLWIILWPLKELQTVKFLNDVYGSKSVREMFGHDGMLNIYLLNLAVDAQPIWELTTKEWRFKEHNPVSDPVLEISGERLQIFRLFGPQNVLKISGEEGAPPNPSPGFATVICYM